MLCCDILLNDDSAMLRYSFSEDDAKLMASMGYNTIRLGVLWAGLEPVMGEYNMTYLEQVVECVNIAERWVMTILKVFIDL